MASSLQPAATTLHEHVLRLLQGKDVRAAEAACRRLVGAHPEYARGWRTASIIALRRGDPASALASVDRARALASDDNDALLLDAIGTLFSRLGDQLTARAVYDHALVLAPGHAGILFNRATARRFLGELFEAEEDLNRVIAARPADYEAYQIRSDMRTQTAARNHTQELEALLAHGIKNWSSEVQIRHALAKEYEDLGEYSLSWTQLAQGAQCRRRHSRYDVGKDVETVRWIMAAFPAGPTEDTGYPSTEPIFVLGLPRSGSTLVERILSSHSAVVAAGELNQFAQAIVRAVRKQRGEGPIERAELVASSAAIDFAALGDDYIQSTRPVTGHLPRFIDKMPLNYLYCGLIHRALPKAKIIHVSRRPMAACYAIYKTLFKDGYPFSYDLEDLGRYYVGYRQLMNHWRTTLPGVIYEVSYEHLVSDIGGETGRLLEFCGLAWEDACVDYHRNLTPTTTASAVQVRQPLYRSSIDQWRYYAAQLEGLRRQLLVAGVPDL